MKEILLITILLTSLSSFGQRRLLFQAVSDSCDIHSVYYANNSFYVGNESDQFRGIEISQDGGNLFVADQGVDSIFQYTLSVPFSVESATYSGAFYVGGQSSFINDIFLRDDGLKLFCVDNISDRVYSFTMTSSNDISTISYDGVSFDPVESAESFSLDFSKDGTTMYVGDSFRDSVYQYSLTAWDISTATFDNKALYVKKDANTTVIRFCGSGSSLYVQDAINTFFRFNLSTPWDISTASDSEESNIVTIFNSFDVNSTNEIIIGRSSSQDSVYQFKY